MSTPYCHVSVEALAPELHVMSASERHGGVEQLVHTGLGNAVTQPSSVQVLNCGLYAAAAV